ncbi:hypothetical protein Y032_0024g1060 [Ancylostoma ceylanicum]|uniref:Uncharacterized protein n=1 Tax=Ancylostoma ceylanicum TaxID=53326 RepID=A0A016UVZ9_9BILA|nr:hypothetical protein Y032_0024g1060 [Ancylostoma ceylanicum]
MVLSQFHQPLNISSEKAGIKETVVPFANSCCVYDNPVRLANNNATYLLLNFIYGQNPRYFEDYLADVRQILKFSVDYSREGDYIVDLLKIDSASELHYSILRLVK